MSEDTLFRKRERGGMHFHGRKRSKQGALGFAFSLISVVGFLVLCVVSAMAKGEAGEHVGIFGVLVMALCGTSFYLSLKGLKERDVYTTLPLVGLIVSGTLFVLMFCLYVMGIQF